MVGECRDQVGRGAAVHELLAEFAFEVPDVAREILRVDAERGRGGTHRRMVAEVDERNQAFPRAGAGQDRAQLGRDGCSRVEGAAMALRSHGAHGQIVAAAPAQDRGRVQAELSGEVFGAAAAARVLLTQPAFGDARRWFLRIP